MVEVAGAGHFEVGDVEDAAGGALNELGAVVVGTEVAVGADHAEVVGREAVGPRVLGVDVGEPLHVAVVRPHLLDVGYLVEVPVLVVVGRGNREAAGLGVGELVGVLRHDAGGEQLLVDRVHVPRVGRGAALGVFVDEREFVAVDVGVAVGVLPRVDLGGGRRREGLRGGDAVGAEHEVELPAVGHAVAVAVGVERLEGEVLPRLRDVHRLLADAGEADRLEVAREHVLVERGERLGERVGGVDRGGLPVAELVVDLGVDERHRHRRDGVDLEGAGREDIGAEAGVGDGDEVGAGLVGDYRHVVVGGDEVGGRDHVAHAVGGVGVAHEVARAGGVGDEAVDAVGDGECHQVAVRGELGVGHERVGVGEAGLPAVGHAVAIGVPPLLIGVGVAGLLVAGEAVEVDVARVGAGGGAGRGGGEQRLVLVPVEDVVAVDVGVLHEHLDRRNLGAGRVDLGAERTPDGRQRMADLGGVAPGLVGLALGVAVAVDEGDREVLVGVEAEEGDGRGVGERVRLGGEVGGVEAGLRGGDTGEVGVAEELHDHRAELVGGRAVVAHLDVGAAEAGREVVRRGEPGLEGGEVAPRHVRGVGVGELGVEHRHAPAVVGVVVERPGVVAYVVADVDRRRPEVAAEGVGRRQRGERRGVDVRLGVPDLEDEGGVAVGAGPLELGPRGLDLRVGEGARRVEGGLDRLGGVLHRERAGHIRRVDVLHRAAAEGDGVADFGDVVERDRLHRLEVGAQAGPVEAELAGGDEVALVDGVALDVAGLAAVDDAALDALLGAVNRGADDAQGVDGVGAAAVGEALAGGLRGVGHLDDERGHLVPADLDVLHEADRVGAGGEGAVAVSIDERDEGGDALGELAAVGPSERDLEVLGLQRRQLGLVHETQEVLRQRDAIGHEIRLEHADVEVEVAGDEVDVAHALVEEQDMALHRAVDGGDLEGELVVAGAAVAGGEGVGPDKLLRLHLATAAVGGDRRPHLIVGAGVEAEAVAFVVEDLPAEDVVGLGMRHLERERAEVVDHPARGEGAVEDAVLEEAEVEVAGLAGARGDGVDGVGLVLEVVAGVGVDDDRRGGADWHLGAVVAQGGVDDRDRVVLDLLDAGEVRDELLGGRQLVVGVAQLAPGRPAVLVGVGVGVVAGAVEAVRVLLEVLHEVVVGVELAEVDGLAERVGGLDVVVDHVLGDGVGEGRVEGEEAVALGHEVLLVVGEAVVVGVGDGVVLRAGVDLVHVLPPVGDAVVVEVAVVGELGVVLAVGEHAAGEVAQVGGPGGHDDAVVVDGGVPADALRRVERVAVVVARVVGPPVGQAVEVGVGAGLGPGVGGGSVVPHAALGGGYALGVGAAERQQVEALLQAIAHGEVVGEQEGWILGDPVVALVDGGRGDRAVQRLAPAAPGLGRAREGDLRIAEGGGELAANHVLAPVLGVGGGLVEPRQMADGVGNPRNPGLVMLLVDGRADFNQGPPRVLPVLGSRPDGLGVDDALGGGEAGGAVHHHVGADAAGHVVERPVALELGREQVLGGRRAVDDALAPDLPDGLAVGDRVGAGVALLVVGADLALGARAVPYPDFVDVAPEVAVVVAELGADHRKLAVEAVHHDALEGRRRRAHEDGGVVAPVGPAFEPSADVGADRGDAVFGPEAGLDLLVLDAVDVEAQVFAVEGRRDVRPVGGRERAVENLLRIVDGGAGRVVHRVPAAVLDADEEVLAEELLVAEVRLAGVDRALNHRLVAGEVALGLGPALDGVVEERQVVADDRANGRVLGVLEGGLEKRVLAGEVHRLAAQRRVGVLRVGGALGLAGGLVVVGNVVVVGVVALVLLKVVRDVKDIAEVEVDAGDGECRRLAVNPGVAHEVVELVLLQGLGVEEAVGRAEDDEAADLRGDVVAVGNRPLVVEVGHPQRRRVGVEPGRLGLHVRHDRLGLVAQVVAVGVGVGEAVEPGIGLEVVVAQARANAPGLVDAPAGVGALGAVRRPLFPVVDIGGGGRRLLGTGGALSAAVRGEDEVVAAVAAFARASDAEQRVHAVVELVVVVHAVAVGVGEGRVAADVPVWRDDVARERAEVVAAGHRVVAEALWRAAG